MVKKWSSQDLSIDWVPGREKEKSRWVDDNIQVPHDLTIHQHRRNSRFGWKVDDLCLEQAEMAERQVEGPKLGGAQLTRMHFDSPQMVVDDSRWSGITQG